MYRARLSGDHARPACVRWSAADRSPKDRILGTASLDDPGFESGFDVYSDHTRIATALTPEQVEGTVEHLRSLSGKTAGVRWAIVTSSPASYGMMRMLCVRAVRIPMEVRVFRSSEEAEAWLDSPR